jgi:hypothetical protein
LLREREKAESDVFAVIEMPDEDDNYQANMVHLDEFIEELLLLV